MPTSKGSLRSEHCSWIACSTQELGVWSFEGQETSATLGVTVPTRICCVPPLFQECNSQDYVRPLQLKLKDIMVDSVATVVVALFTHGRTLLELAQS